jgi:hypothetical protein
MIYDKSRMVFDDVCEPSGMRQKKTIEFSEVMGAVSQFSQRDRARTPVVPRRGLRLVAVLVHDL